MIAITIHQPYASLIAIGAKRYETRSRATKYRGRIAIHAGMKDPLETLDNTPFYVWDTMLCALGIESFFDWGAPRGAIIATAELVGCYPIVEPARIEGMVSTGKMLKPDIPVSVYGSEYLFGDWTPGRYAWELADVQRLPEPVPVRGQQGLWNLEDKNDV